MRGQALDSGRHRQSPRCRLEQGPLGIPRLPPPCHIFRMPSPLIPTNSNRRHLSDGVVVMVALLAVTVALLKRDAYGQYGRGQYTLQQHTRPSVLVARKTTIHDTTTPLISMLSRLIICKRQRCTSYLRPLAACLYYSADLIG